MLKFEEHGRVGLETKMMFEFLIHQTANVKEFCSTQDEEFSNLVISFYENIVPLLSKNSGEIINYKDTIIKILERYNRCKRLKQEKQSDQELLPQLLEMEKNYNMNLLPPPMPSEYLSEEIWLSDESKWIGHGYYWKSGEGNIHKDLSFSDYDSLEDHFYQLSNANVLVADYNLIQNDFPELKNQSIENINKWLIKNSAFISEGQIKRCLEGGDQYELIENINDKYDKNTNKIGVRMKGGGRAASFLVDDKYSWNDNGLFHADMLEVKGIGTSILQPEIEQKACGFLSYVDALKEFAYEKLIQRISVLENQSWNTVQYYAIIDTGIKYKNNCKNPATGYEGDRCVLVVRQRQSRIISTFDEIVYYSVVRRNLLEYGRGNDFCKTLLKYGISSEQLPVLLSNLNDNDAFSLEGDWNVQSDSCLSHIIDFSHFFVLPSSNLHDKWKMSLSDVQDALLLGAEHFNLFSDTNLQKIFDNETNDIKKFFEDRQVDLNKKYGSFGCVGKRKPNYSWSWFLEVDSSWIMNFAMKTGLGLENNHLSSSEIFEIISNILPEKK